MLLFPEVVVVRSGSEEVDVLVVRSGSVKVVSVVVVRSGPAAVHSGPAELRQGVSLMALESVLHHVLPLVL